MVTSLHLEQVRYIDFTQRQELRITENGISRDAIPLKHLPGIRLACHNLAANEMHPRRRAQVDLGIIDD